MITKEQIEFGIHVTVQECFENNSIKVWVYEETIGGLLNYAFEYYPEYKMPLLVKKEIPINRRSDEELYPLFELPYQLSKPVLRALSEHLANTGYKTKDESMIEGKLVATEKHLEDMRSLVTKLIDNVIK